jgi:hypothetical protein
VVRVVVSERTDGAGEENVLSLPRPELTPTVAFVASPDEGACEGAASECAWSCSVDMVAASDLLPIVGGGNPSTDDRTECLRSKDVVLIEVPVGTVENERCPFGAAEFPFIGRPDSGYGLLFLVRFCFFELAFIWYVFRFVEGRPFGSAVEEPPLKFASFFIHVENGRRRP